MKSKEERRQMHMPKYPQHVNSGGDAPGAPRFDIAAERPSKGALLVHLTRARDYDVFATIARDVVFNHGHDWARIAVMANILAGRPYDDGIRSIYAIEALSRLIDDGYLPVTFMERAAP